MSSALLTRSEAAQLSGASSVAVKKAIDQGVIPARSVKRASLVEAEDVGLLALLALIQDAQLPVAQKKRLRSWLRSSGSAAELELSPALVVRRTPEVGEAVARAERYARLREKWIVTDEERRAGGEPIIKGSRVSVYTIAGRLAAGDSDQALELDYPHIPAEAREVAAAYGSASPRRGRPRRIARQP
ncbi:MAG TPA: DUF433 domain-containing protein [Solirubrobacteraceae bacterium]|jgi:uncharacterized protein (DUF433 family)|nr:DUF433 domain-containing protein [Solirubrobacteraceae bacterium]